jgi:hypothetical protein
VLVNSFISITSNTFTLSASCSYTHIHTHTHAVAAAAVAATPALLRLLQARICKLCRGDEDWRRKEHGAARLVRGGIYFEQTHAAALAVKALFPGGVVHGVEIHDHAAVVAHPKDRIDAVGHGVVRQQWKAHLAREPVVPNSVGFIQLHHAAKNGRNLRPHDRARRGVEDQHRVAHKDARAVLALVHLQRQMAESHGGQGR